MLSLLIKMSLENCLRTLIKHQRSRQSTASANKRRINMETTLTQNSALYYAQHKTSKGRAALFKKLRAGARKRRPDVRRQLTSGDLFVVARLHKDNGRGAASLIALMNL